MAALPLPALTRLIMEQSAIKLLFATDTPDEAFGADPALVGAEDIEVLGSIAPGEDIIGLVKRRRPDVVVIDYDMPGVDAAGTTHAILREDPSIQVLMLSLVGDVGDIRHAMRAGARDYLIKPLQTGELVETVRWLISECREYARMQAFVQQMRRAYDALFTDDKPVPQTVVAFLVQQAVKDPADRLAQETLAVAYARNRDWQKLAPVAVRLAETTLE